MGVTAITDIPKVMAGFLIAESLYSLFPDQPIAAFEPARKALELTTQPHSAMFVEEVTRRDNVAGTGVRVSVNTRQRSCQLVLAGRHQHGLDRLERPQPHAGRAAAREEAKDHLLPQFAVVPAPADGGKFGQPRTYFATTPGMCQPYLFNR